MSIAVLPEPKAASSIVVANGDDLYEVVNGERVEMQPMSVYSIRLGTRIATRMDIVAEPRGLGTVVSEALFILDAEMDLRRRPDVAFVSKERWPLDRPIPEVGDWLVVPDLAVEVISPNDTVLDYLDKLKEYFEYQVRQVWVVVPQHKEVLVYSSPSQYRTLRFGDELDGGDILPGFRLKLSELFNQPVAVKTE